MKQNISLAGFFFGQEKNCKHQGGGGVSPFSSLLASITFLMLIFGVSLGISSCSSDSSDDEIIPIQNRTSNPVPTVFLAGDSTVKDYSAKGMWNSNKTYDLGSWGEFLPYFFNDTAKVANYAQGGRSSRSFVNEGKLDLIDKAIGQGDYLFIQFGHNDCASQAEYRDERYVPLGDPNEQGIYPVIAGEKTTTPSNFTQTYGKTYYAYNSGGTYKWFLKQYIDVAKKHNAIPVLVTPVSRAGTYFTESGTIKAHHKDGFSQTGKDDYVEAAKQLATEEGVRLIDGFAISKKLYEDAYTAAGTTTTPRNFPDVLMGRGNAWSDKGSLDSTHNNKLGGFILAGLVAKQIKQVTPNLGEKIKMPSCVDALMSTGQSLFKTDKDGVISIADGETQGMKAKLCDTANNTVIAPDAAAGQAIVDYWKTYISTLLSSQDFPIDEQSSSTEQDLPTFKGTSLYLAGDSTVQSYDGTSPYSSTVDPRGSWGEFLQSFLDKDKVQVFDYGASGRSSRSYINEGKLEDIKKKLKKGDILFIEFGHNDEKSGSPDVGTPLGTPDENGIYPVTEGEKGADGKYTGGTFKWYLKQYIDLAKALEATPVLLTPLSRLKFDAEGKIAINHRDDSDKTSEKNTYCEAVKQLASEEGVSLLDCYTMSVAIYEKAYSDYKRDAPDATSFTKEADFLFNLKDTTDKTHNSKLGGFILAGLLAKEFKNSNDAVFKPLKESVITPKNVRGNSTSISGGKAEFVVNSRGIFALGANIVSSYWTEYVNGTLLEELK